MSVEAWETTDCASERMILEAVRKRYIRVPRNLEMASMKNIFRNPWAPSRTSLKERPYEFQSALLYKHDCLNSRVIGFIDLPSRLQYSFLTTIPIHLLLSENV